MLEIQRCPDAGAPATGKLAAVLNRKAGFPPEIVDAVAEILRRVEAEGDAAVAGYTEKFDGVVLAPGGFRVPRKALDDAWAAMDRELEEAVSGAAANIRSFHRRQLRGSWFHEDGEGVVLGKRVLPLRRVGLCVPGGQTPLLSTLLMTAVPAQVAGVDEICVVTPPRPGGLPHPVILATAAMLELDEVYAIGGAQAVAALAFGTQTVAAVDKIAGPGGPYTAAAKQQVYGRVGIDTVAGPSEIAVLADENADPGYVAADLLAQAEHGSGFEAAVCITPSEALAARVQAEAQKQLATLPRRREIETALKNFGLVVVVPDLEAGVRLVDRIAPEHVELLVADPWRWLGEIRNAGAVFLGEASSEPVGDYFAGTNHVLPTNGAARFASALGVDDFVRTTSVLGYSGQRLRRTGAKIARLARAEELEAHARAIEARLDHSGRDS